VVCNILCVWLMPYRIIEVFVKPPSQTVLSVVAEGSKGFELKRMTVVRRSLPV